MSGAMTQRLVAVAQAADTAGHGERGAIYTAACAELGLSRATLLRRLSDVRVMKPRRRRTDAGTSALSQEEAIQISAVLMEGFRKNGKRIMAIERAVDILRANKKIRAEAIDQETGEVRSLSISTIGRALHTYGLHPDQLMRPEPVTELASLHPNHVWQIDASLCVLYYLPRKGADNGLRMMSHTEFYKNKPGNMARIEQDRVWRYVITDHTSGVVFVRYVFGGETAENIVNVLNEAMSQREGDPFHGAPWVLMLDPGSANTSAMLRNLCIALGIHLQINTPGRPRAKGQVEQANNLVECEFESSLKLVAKPQSLEELNALVTKWCLWFNTTQKHSRHGHTRYGLWQTIRAEHLRIVPDASVLRELAVSAPVTRTVSPKLHVSFKGNEYDVSTVPGVGNGEKLELVTNPWRENTVQVVLIGENGHRCYHVCEQVERDDYGFTVGSAIISESYKRHTDTPAQRAAKSIELLGTGADTLIEAAATRKAETVPFGGTIDPFKHQDETVLPAFLPRRGTELSVPGRVHVEVMPLNHVQAAALLRPLIPGWNADTYQRMVQQYPDGVMEADLQKVATQLMAADETPAPVLRVVGG